MYFNSSADVGSQTSRRVSRSPPIVRTAVSTAQFDWRSEYKPTFAQSRILQSTKRNGSMTITVFVHDRSFLSTIFNLSRWRFPRARCRVGRLTYEVPCISNDPGQLCFSSTRDRPSLQCFLFCCVLFRFTFKKKHSIIIRHTHYTRSTSRVFRANGCLPFTERKTKQPTLDLGTITANNNQLIDISK